MDVARLHAPPITNHHPTPRALLGAGACETTGFEARSRRGDSLPEWDLSHDHGW